MGTERQAVLLVEDDPHLGPLVATVLGEVYDVTLLADGAAGFDAAVDGDFDALVIDRRLPELDGVAVVQRLRAIGIATPILMLTALGTIADRVDGLDAGANDYLVKPFDFDELLARVRALLRVFTGDGERISIGTWEFNPERHSIHSPYDGRIMLAPREAAVLALLARDPERTFSRHRILERVFDADDQPGTVDTYVHYIRRKTDKAIIETVRGRGYRLGSL